MITHRYLHGAAVDERLVHWQYDQNTGAEVSERFYHRDHQGSIIAMSDASGNRPAGELYTYDAYGNMVTGTTSGQPFRYTGRRWDDETGLYYYRARYYSAALGRFLQTDPIGYEDNMNMYGYVGNDPLNNTDPTGQDSFVVARALDIPFATTVGVGHAFIVTDARYIGDPDAKVHSFGELKNGNMGNVTDPSRASDVSSTANETDVKAWLALSRGADKNVVKIDASDELVNEVVAGVQEDRPYAAVPNSRESKTIGGRVPRTVQTPGVNSNSAAFAVGDTAQQVSTGDPTSQVSRDPFMSVPGQSASKKVKIEAPKEVCAGRATRVRSC